MSFTLVGEARVRLCGSHLCAVDALLERSCTSVCYEPSSDREILVSAVAERVTAVPASGTYARRRGTPVVEMEISVYPYPANVKGA